MQGIYLKFISIRDKKIIKSRVFSKPLKKEKLSSIINKNTNKKLMKL